MKYNDSSNQNGSADVEASTIIVEEDSIISVGGFGTDIKGFRLFNLNDKQLKISISSGFSELVTNTSNSYQPSGFVSISIS